ncbi:putative bifunctional diguanylate cyclase/phosphodiesterase [Alishewanella longhuensis]|nr:EAL domain-containing protein [Alishewanella longhuensis]
MSKPKLTFNKWHYYPLLGAAIYLLFGIIWISFSDSLLVALVTEPAALMRYQTYKGFAYIIITAIIAWFLLKQRYHFANSLADSEQLLDLTFEHAAAGMAYVATNGSFVQLNKEFCNILGYSAAELRQMSFQQITHPMDLSKDETLLQRTLAGELQRYSLEKRYLHKNGHVVWARLSVALLPKDHNSTARFLSVIQDISAVALAQQQLQESELRFRALLDKMPNISVQGYNETGTTLYWNKGSELIYGYSRQEALGNNLLDLIIPQRMHEGVKEAISLMASSGQPRAAEELTLQRKDGSPVTVYSSHAVIILPDKKPQIYCIDIDLTERKQQEAKLAFLAEYDPLTHLPNRHLFATKLEQALKVARREHLQLAVLILDLDNFKTINDSYGHNAGDLLLKRIAEKLQLCCGENETLARLGGDEFAILVEHLPHPEDAARFAMELLKSLQQPMVLQFDIEVTSSASIGISLFPQHTDKVEALLQGADAALYKAKADGRNTYSYYTDQLTAMARERLILEAKLRHALKHEQLECYYQAQINLTTNQIIGAELLIRWFDAERGYIAPDQFIPVAESCGLIQEIGQFVLKQACTQGQAWLKQGLPQIRLAVNVSTHQFSKGDLQQHVSRVLQQTGFPAQLLELEVTESALMEDKDRVIHTMQQLRAAGIRLAIDDFGTGYSSLAYLQQLPLDVLKVDRRFIDRITDNEDDRQISRAIIELGHTLRFEVLAEGVETAEQLALLKDMACDYYQGYYYSKPLPAEAFRQLLLAQSAMQQQQ